MGGVRRDGGGGRTFLDGGGDNFDKKKIFSGRTSLRTSPPPSPKTMKTNDTHKNRTEQSNKSKNDFQLRSFTFSFSS